MTAATEPRDTPALPGLSPTLLRRTVGTGQTVFEGCLAFQQPVSATLASAPSPGVFVLGRLEETGEAGEDVNIKRGVFRYANAGGGDALSLADYGQPCYAVDNQTVAKTDGGGARPKAGVVRDVDAAGVWVEI